MANLALSLFFSSPSFPPLFPSSLSSLNSVSGQQTAALKLDRQEVPKWMD